MEYLDTALASLSLLPAGTLYLKLLGVEGLLDYSYLMALSGSESSPPRTYSAGSSTLYVMHYITSSMYMMRILLSMCVCVCVCVAMLCVCVCVAMLCVCVCVAMLCVCVCVAMLCVCVCVAMLCVCVCFESRGLRSRKLSAFK